MKSPLRNLVLRNGMASYAAFTLLEVLVAVAALAVLAVGIAAIFDTTGKTVKAGRRVSNFSAAAAQLEQILRQDIASMTRDGFLVIRNQYADVDADGVVRDNIQSSNGDRVLLSSEDISPRLRRIDELMFFSKGRFRSVREPLAAGYVPESETARIYYGHPRKRLRDITANSLYLRPDISDTFENEANTFLGYDDADNPNRFASDWVLLRHLTLLRPPPTTPVTPTGLPAGISAANAADSDIQIALQPAAASIFRSLNTIFPLTLPNRIRGTENRPALASGMVDIATTDLSEIANIIRTADTWPGSVPTGASGAAAGNNFFDPANNAGQDGRNAGPDGQWRSAGPAPGFDPFIWRRMHAWMDDAFPANSMGTGNSLTRMRCESAPNNYVGVASTLTSPELDYRRADQLMLSSSNFMPRCTEFIVEWSMGASFPSDPTSAAYVPGRAGELVWYGMERQVGNRLVAAPYAASHLYAGGNDDLPWRQLMVMTYPRVDGQVGTRAVPQEPQLIHGTYDIAEFFAPVSSYFGWTDPTFDPEEPSRYGTAATQPHNGKLDRPTESACETIEWPWPRMIRVTLSLADPSDPTIEQTFQFIIDVPAGHDGR
jgi:hypothetical protein